MKPSSRIGLIVAVVLLLVGIGLYLGRPSEATPEELIRLSLSEAEKGAKAGSSSRIMEAISDDFRSGMWNKKRLYLQVVRSLREGRGTDYDARVSAPRIFPSPTGNPNERLVYSRLSVFYAGTGESIWGSGGVALVMRKESRRKWLLFAEPYWRVISVANLPPLPGAEFSTNL